MISRATVPALALLALAACATPTTYNPSVTKAEIDQEMRLQVQAAKQAPINFNEKKPYGKNQVAALEARFKPIAQRVENATNGLCKAMQLQTACNYETVLDASERGLNAHADGKNVVVYPAMIDFAKNDNHLAFVIAHEFAHNMMEHISAAQRNVTIGALLGMVADAAAASQGANTEGAFGKIGAEQGMLSYSSDFESEADYVGLYILARAGYNIDEAPNFWRMMSQAEPDAIYISRTHPSNPNRTIAMTKTVAEIRAKQRARQPLLPNIRTE